MRPSPPLPRRVPRPGESPRQAPRRRWPRRTASEAGPSAGAAGGSRRNRRDPTLSRIIRDLLTSRSAVTHTPHARQAQNGKWVWQVIFPGAASAGAVYAARRPGPGSRGGGRRVCHGARATAAIGPPRQATVDRPGAPSSYDTFVRCPASLRNWTWNSTRCPSRVPSMTCGPARPRARRGRTRQAPGRAGVASARGAWPAWSGARAPTRCRCFCAQLPRWTVGPPASAAGAGRTQRSGFWVALTWGTLSSITERDLLVRGRARSRRRSGRAAGRM